MTSSLPPVVSRLECGGRTASQMNWMTIDDLEIGVIPVLAAVAPGLDLFFPGRIGGSSEAPFDSLNLGDSTGDATSAVHANRKKLLASLGIEQRRLVRGKQVHGSRIEIVGRGGIFDSTDGFITSEMNLCLAINTADCFPVVIYSPSERVLAALHVGRSGAAEGIIEKTFGILTEMYDIDIGNTVAVTGPGICRSCYTVGNAEAKHFPEKVKSSKGGSWHLDIMRFCELEFKKAGVRKANIFRAGECTSCRSDRWFSYRRDGGVTGRHWTLAVMKPSP